MTESQETTELEEHAERACECLRKAVARALETKRRLGQYAVVYRDGKIVHLSPEEIPPMEDS